MEHVEWVESGKYRCLNVHVSKIYNYWHLLSHGWMSIRHRHKLFLEIWPRGLSQNSVLVSQNSLLVSQNSDLLSQKNDAALSGHCILLRMACDNRHGWLTHSLGGFIPCWTLERLDHGLVEMHLAALGMTPHPTSPLLQDELSPMSWGFDTEYGRCIFHDANNLSDLNPLDKKPSSPILIKASTNIIS